MYIYIDRTTGAILGAAEKDELLYANAKLVEVKELPAPLHECVYSPKRKAVVKKNARALTTQKKAERLQTMRDARAAAYPAVGDQLDVIWKQFAVLRMQGKLNLIEDADAMLGKILRVKKEHHE